MYRVYLKAYQAANESEMAGRETDPWESACISPPAWFYFGKEAKDAPEDIVKRGFDRIQFGHSELSGYMSHTDAFDKGASAASNVMAKLV